MKGKILQLCKLLNRFTLDEIIIISEMPADDLLPILNAIISENKLLYKNGVYSYLKKQTVSDKYPILKYYPKATIDLVLKCFCESITTTKTSHILSMGEDQVQKIYTIFRKIIYEQQKKLLDSNYFKNPQNARHRIFFEKEVYLYIYNHQVFISKTLLQSPNDKSLNSNDKAEFSKIYCYLTRNLTHNQNKHNLEYKIAEILWRRNKKFDELYLDLKGQVS